MANAKQLPLQIQNRRHFGTSPWPHFHWKSSLPFVENSKGVLIHRPRYVVYIPAIGSSIKGHIGIEFYCGSSQNGSKKFTFLPEPDQSSIVCEKCDKAAIKAGLKSSYQLLGRHVCVGGVKAKRTCCSEVKEGA